MLSSRQVVDHKQCASNTDLKNTTPRVSAKKKKKKKIHQNPSS